MSFKRITKEFAEASQAPPAGFTIALLPFQSIHTWHVVLAPLASTPYHPGRFALRFLTRIYHPNITNDSLGNVCLGLLKPDQWKPSTKIAAVLDAVRSLLVEPQPDDPLEDRIADEFRNDRPRWEKTVRQNVQRYALTEPAFPSS